MPKIAARELHIVAPNHLCDPQELYTAEIFFRILVKNAATKITKFLQLTTVMCIRIKTAKSIFELSKNILI